MNFIDVIKSIPEISIYLRNGLQALGTYSKKVVACSTRDLEGSVDIDTNLKRNFPNAHRWDYVFGYKDRIFYVEIHPADNTRKVGEITAKLEWLKQWRKLYAKKT